MDRSKIQNQRTVRLWNGLGAESRTQFWPLFSKFDHQLRKQLEGQRFDYQFEIQLKECLKDQYYEE